LYPRPLLIVVGDPLSTASLTTRDADALTQRLYDSISATYSRYAPQENPTR
jgi:1-acyl-sn-glycerol-3-phosphate acyltransferase